jgi:hypothetical protein
MMTNVRVVAMTRRLTACATSAAVAAAVLLATAIPAGAVSGQAGPIAISVTPTSGVGDGQMVTIHAAANPGSDLYQITAHLCQGGVSITDNYNFGFDGPYCTKQPVSADSDAETTVEIPRGSGGKGDLAFRVGAGTAPTWFDFDGVIRSFTCGPGSPCQLVVQLQVPNDTAFYSATLCYGGDCPPEAPPAPPPAAPAAAGDGGQGNGAAAGQGSKAGAGSGQGSGQHGTSDAAGKQTGTATPASTAVPAAANGQDAQRAATGVSATSVSDAGHALSRATRVLLGGLAGLIGGALIVLIVLRARRRMQSEVWS